jgi:hypothetical protein
MKVVKVPSWVLPFGYGITLHKLVLVDKNSSNLGYVVMHEYCHTLQWEREGVFRF